MQFFHPLRESAAFVPWGLSTDSVFLSPRQLADIVSALVVRREESSLERPPFGCLLLPFFNTSSFLDPHLPPISYLILKGRALFFPFPNVPQSPLFAILPSLVERDRYVEFLSSVPVPPRSQVSFFLILGNNAGLEGDHFVFSKRLTSFYSPLFSTPPTEGTPRSLFLR